ncbi:MAG: hypothetical protein ACLRWP_11265 [Bilophila wadsworthia]
MTSLTSRKPGHGLADIPGGDAFATADQRFVRDIEDGRIGREHIAQEPARDAHGTELPAGRAAAVGCFGVADHAKASGDLYSGDGALEHTRIAAVDVGSVTGDGNAVHAGAAVFVDDGMPVPLDAVHACLAFRGEDVRARDDALVAQQGGGVDFVGLAARVVHDFSR